MADDAVRIDVLLDDLKAEANLKNLESGSKRAFRTFETESRRGTAAARGFTSSLGGLRRAFGFAASLAGGFALAATIRKSVSAFIEQEQAVQRVTGALAVQGITSRAVSRELQDYAAQLQKITTYGDEAYLAGLALAMNMGSTVDQAKELTAAAADLSAALGQDLQTSIRMLGQTLSGQALTLARYLPAVRELSKEELRAGGAISFVRNRFGGMAAGLAQSDSGRYQQAINAFGDELEKLGSRVLPVFTTSIVGITRALDALGLGPDEKAITPVERARAQIEMAGGQARTGLKSMNDRLSGFGLPSLPQLTLDRNALETFDHLRISIEGLQQRIAYVRRDELAIGTKDPNWRLKSEGLERARLDLESQLAGLQTQMNEFVSSVTGNIAGFESGRMGELTDLLDAIETSKGATEAAKALFEAINTPSAEELYRQRMAGIDAGLSAYQLAGSPITHAQGSDAEKKAEKLRMQTEFSLLSETQPALVRFHDEFKLGVADSFEGGILTAVRGGGVRGALQQMSQALADSVSQAFAKALTDRFLGGLLGEAGGLDKAFLSLFGGGGEAPAGAAAGGG